MIEVRNLTFTYPGGDRPAIRGLGFAVEHGEIFGCLGPSGAGKSTTQKILTGLLKGYGGSVAVLGRELTAWGADYYEHIGVSFELPNHYQKLTALENLAFFRSLYSGPTADPRGLLAMVRLAGNADTRVARFSKGMQMRLTLARALLNCPRVLFLDEPTSGLDPVNAHAVMDIIRDRRQAGCTVFMTTHSMSVAEALCDRVAFVDEGRIALIDSPRTLKLRYGTRQVRVEYRQGERAAHRDFPLDGLGTNAAFLTLLREEQVETIHTREANLDDIFGAVTGRGLQ